MAGATREEKEEAAADLGEIQQKMFGLLGEAGEIVKQIGDFGESGKGGARAQEARNRIRVSRQGDLPC